MINTILNVTNESNIQNMMNRQNIMNWQSTINWENMVNGQSTMNGQNIIDALDATKNLIAEILNMAKVLHTSNILNMISSEMSNIVNNLNTPSIEEMLNTQSIPKKECVLSIDIGTKNLALVVIECRTYRCVYSEIINVDANHKKSTNIINHRIEKIKSSIYSIKDRYTIVTVIIEKQVNKNGVAMCLMYSIATFAYEITNNVVIFDPKNKFKVNGLNYTTENRAHKRLSIEIAKLFSDAVNKYDKQDDVADAINQAICYIAPEYYTKTIRNNLEKLRQINDYEELQFD